MIYMVSAVLLFVLIARFLRLFIEKYVQRKSMTNEIIWFTLNSVIDITRPINGVKERKMGFTMKSYSVLKEDWEEGQLKIFLGGWKVTKIEELPPHRQPLVKFIELMIQELDKLPERATPALNLEQEKRKARILYGLMWVTFEPLSVEGPMTTGSTLRKNLIAAMGVNEENPIDPNAGESMIENFLDFYKKFVFPEGDSTKPMKEVHEFSVVGNKILASFEQQAVQMLCSVKLNIFSGGRHKREEIIAQRDAKPSRLKSLLSLSFLGGKKEEEEEEEEDLKLVSRPGAGASTSSRPS